MSRPITQFPSQAEAAPRETQVDSMELFLMETRYCDVSHPGIQELALRLTAGVDEPVARARAIFEWVRDKVFYVIPHDWSQKASETLATRMGSCTNKANLLVAMARVVGIPAAYEVLRVRGKHYLGPIWIPMLQDICDEVSSHVRAALFLDGRWMKCDPTNDSELSEAIGHLNPPSAQAVFDGVNDATSFLAPENMLGSLGLMPDGDRILGKRTDKPPIFFTVINCFLEMGRELGPTSHDELGPASHGELGPASHGELGRASHGELGRACNGDVGAIQSIFDAWMRERYPAEYYEFVATVRREQRAAA